MPTPRRPFQALTLALALTTCQAVASSASAEIVWDWSYTTADGVKR